MSADQKEPELIQVLISGDEMVGQFRTWVQAQGWHLAGPRTFGEDGTPTYLLSPMPSPEALGEEVRRIKARWVAEDEAEEGQR